MEKNKKNEEDKERDECILELNRSFAFWAIQENMLRFMPDVESIIFNDRYGDTAYCRQLLPHPVDEEEIKKNISLGKVMPKDLVDIVNAEDSEAYGVKVADYQADMENLSDLSDAYFLILVSDGLYFFLDNEEIAFVKYEDVKDARESMDILEIETSGIMWFKNGEPNCTKEEKGITLRRTDVNGILLHGLRRGLCSVRQIFYGGSSLAEWDIESIIKERIERISKESYYKPYLERRGREIEEARKYDKIKKNALKSYAVKARCDDIIGFIDTSFFKNGKDGILFTKDGLAFDYLSEPIFIRYDEIQTMDIVDGGLFKIKYLVFYGRFRDYSMDYSISKVHVSDVYFDIDALKDCVEQILCVA